MDIRYKDPFSVTQRHIKSRFKKKELAKSYEASIIEKTQAKELLPIKQSKTISEVYDEYIKLEGSVKYARATLVYYNNTFNTYVRGKFGNSYISSVDYLKIQKYINELSERNNYPTVFNVKRALAATFKYAVRVGYRTEMCFFFLYIVYNC